MAADCGRLPTMDEEHCRLDSCDVASGFCRSGGCAGLDAIAARLLGAVQGFVGGLNDLLGSAGASVGFGESDAHGYRERAASGWGGTEAGRTGTAARSRGAASVGAAIGGSALASLKFLAPRFWIGVFLGASVGVARA